MRLDPQATDLSVGAETVGVDIDAERLGLGLPRVENWFAIYDSDSHKEPD
jgi:hypothetical protein